MVLSMNKLGVTYLTHMLFEVQEKHIMTLAILLMLAACVIIQTEGAEDIDCMLQLLKDEFQVPCSLLPRNITRPCLLTTDADLTALKRTKVS